MSARPLKSKTQQQTLELSPLQEDGSCKKNASPPDFDDLHGRATARPSHERGYLEHSRSARECAVESYEKRLHESMPSILDGVIDQALAGSVPAAKTVMERVLPDPRNRLLSFDIRKIKGVDDAIEASGDVIAAVGKGKITLREAETISRLLHNYVESGGALEFLRRLAKLEALMKNHT